MRQSWTRTRRLAALLGALAFAAGLFFPLSNSSAAVIVGDDARRAFGHGPYQGNPDDPGIDRPQMTHPVNVDEFEQVEDAVLVVTRPGGVLTIRFPEAIRRWLVVLGPRSAR